MDIVDNVSATLKDLTIEILGNMNEISTVEKITIEEVPGTVSLRLLFDMEPHQEGDILPQHVLYVFLNEDGVATITPEYKVSYTLDDKRSDDLPLNRESILDLLMRETYFSPKYKMVTRPLRYEE